MLLLKKRYAICIWIFGFLVISITHAGETMPESTASTFFIKQDEIESVVRTANTGDVKSAFRLYNYYTFSKYDDEKSQYWLSKSAELGDATAMYTLAMDCYEKKDFQNALKWAQKAVDAGKLKAKAIIDDIKKKNP